MNKKCLSTYFYLSYISDNCEENVYGAYVSSPPLHDWLSPLDESKDIHDIPYAEPSSSFEELKYCKVTEKRKKNDEKFLRDIHKRCCPE